MKKVFSVLIFVLFFSSIIFACKIVRMEPQPVAAFDHRSYIFVGEVIGYTETIKSGNETDRPRAQDYKFYGEGRGLKIKPLEVVNLPNESKDYFELFIFGVTPWCAPKLTDAVYPVGTKLRIISTEATLLPNRSAENKIRLENRIFDPLSAVRDTDLYVTTAASIFDYKTWKTLLPEILKSKIAEVSSFKDFMFVEIVKDLQRLEKAKSKKERKEILERLLYAPNIDFPKIVNPTVGNLYVSGGVYARLPNYEKQKPRDFAGYEKKLIKKREEIEKSGYFIVEK